MKKLLTDIQARLMALVPALKYVDEDWGQLDYYSPHPPVQFPAALIDVNNGTFSNTGKLVQLGMVQVRLRIADIKLSNTSGKAPQGQRDAAFAIFDTLELIHKTLHGWSGSEHYSKLIRTAMKRVLRDDGMRIYEINYTVELVDNSAVPVKLSFKLT